MRPSTSSSSSTHSSSPEVLDTHKSIPCVLTVITVITRVTSSNVIIISIIIVTFFFGSEIRSYHSEAHFCCLRVQVRSFGPKKPLLGGSGGLQLSFN